MREQAVDCPTALAAVGSALEHYARRGVLRACAGQTPDQRRDGHAFDFVWFHNRRFELLASPAAGRLRIPVLLPEVPPTCSMYADLKRFVRVRQSAATPEHRRIPKRRCRVSCINRRGQVELSIRSVDGDFDFATRSLIHVVNEIFLVFLRNGDYRPYMARVWGLDPDTDQF